MELESNHHSVFLLHYHLVLVVKYRRKVFDDIVSARAREIFEYIAPKYGITVEEWNHDMDHVHVLFRAQPKSELSKFINAYKSASSRLLKQEFPQIRQKLWKEYFWSRSFCLLTTGGAPIEVVRCRPRPQGQRGHAGHDDGHGLHPRRRRQPRHRSVGEGHLHPDESPIMARLRHSSSWETQQWPFCPTPNSAFSA